MWVSGSLIRSSTWRSSSVSAPCISSSICLPSSPERSRTMRGSFCQALPIGCMRVFMTPSCSSAVTLESRCSGTLNSVSSLRREISRSWLRVKHQLGDHGHEVFERVDIDPDRLVGDLVALGHVGLIGGLAGGGLCGGLCFLHLDLLRHFLAGFSFRLPGCRCGSGGRLMGGRNLDRRFAEGPLQLVQRDLAQTQRTLQRLIDQRALGHLGCSGSGGRGCRFGNRLGLAGSGMRRPTSPCRARPSPQAG